MIWSIFQWIEVNRREKRKEKWFFFCKIFYWKKKKRKTNVKSEKSKIINTHNHFQCPDQRIPVIQFTIWNDLFFSFLVKKDEREEKNLQTNKIKNCASYFGRFFIQHRCKTQTHSISSLDDDIKCCCSFYILFFHLQRNRINLYVFFDIDIKFKR